MKVEPGTSGNHENNGVRKKRRSPLSKDAKEIVLNVYNYLSSTMPQVEALGRCESMTGVSSSTVYKISREEKLTGVIQKPKTHLRGRKQVTIEYEVKIAIRRTVYSFFFQNEIPTVKKVHCKIQENKFIPQMSCITLRRVLKKLNFRYEKRDCKPVLIEKEEIIVWRRKYLKQMAECRKQNRKIYYLDETWVDAGHTVKERWQDKSVTNSQEVAIKGQSTGLSAPISKGQRLILGHIGSDSGFLDGCSLLFMSKKPGDYHEDLDTERFEHWFHTVLQYVEPNSAIVMDNASYHSHRNECIPTISSEKSEMQQWLHEKGIVFDEDCTKAELMAIIRQHKSNCMEYVVDEMAQAHGTTVVHIPPYHFELNPMELIWAQVKQYIAKHNVSFKLLDMEHLLRQALDQVTATMWKDAINHVMQEEAQMWQLDRHIDDVMEPVNSSVGNDDSSDISFSAESDESE